MVTWLLIALGGALGATLRHAVNLLVTSRSIGWTPFPTGTFVVNAAGCFAAGLVLGVAARAAIPIEARSFAVIGFLGGFTTFSAFGADTLALMQNGHGGLAFANVAASVIVGLVAVWAGFTAMASQL